MLTEPEYRQKIQQIFDIIEQAFLEIDPDLAECELSLGSLTITFKDQSRCILSAQPSVRQIWLALAARGTAYHFNYDPQTQKWLDDKGRGVEILSFLEKYLKEIVGIDVKI